MYESLLRLLPREGWQPAERASFAHLASRLAGLPTPADPWHSFPRHAELRAAVAAAMAAGDGEAAEEAALELYAHLHMHQAPYTRAERRTMDAAGGYWAHAGGLSPVLRAAGWIRPDTVAIDLGAGNGLQGLLLQLLHPHACTIQVEISRRMVAIGRCLQRWLGIPPERVWWVAGDIRAVRIRGIDFVYLYRPLRPEGPGREFYRGLAADLEVSPRPPVVFSIADCLGGFLPPSFEQVASDGHLTIWRRHDRPVPTTV